MMAGLAAAGPGALAAGLAAGLAAAGPGAAAGLAAGFFGSMAGPGAAAAGFLAAGLAGMGAGAAAGHRYTNSMLTPLNLIKLQQQLWQWEWCSLPCALSRNATGMHSMATYASA